MICENEFCLYWHDNVCVLKEVTLDIQGRCQNCIYVTISETVLDRERKKLFKLYDENCSD